MRTISMLLFLILPAASLAQSLSCRAVDELVSGPLMIAASIRPDSQLAGLEIFYLADDVRTILASADSIRPERENNRRLSFKLRGVDNVLGFRLSFDRRSWRSAKKSLAAQLVRENSDGSASDDLACSRD